MLPDQERKKILKYFPSLVRECDLQKVMWKIASTDNVIKNLMENLAIETDVYHNNRIILFNLMELDSETIFNQFMSALRDNNYNQLADKIENRPSKPPHPHLTTVLHATDLPRNAPPPGCHKPLDIAIKYSTDFACGDNIYSTRSKNRGYLLMINNYEFKSSAYRSAAVVDAQNITTLFEKLNFTIFPYTNSTVAEMMEAIDAFTQMKRKGDVPDIAMMIIMSHGQQVRNKTYIFGVDDVMLEEQWITDKFSNENCEIFKTRPKILIYHVCRGEKADDGALKKKTETDSACTKGPEVEDMRFHSDLLVCHPSLEGCKAHRNSADGCWYIEFLCKIIMENAHNKHFESMLKLLNLQLKDKVSEFGTQQTAVFNNISFRDCYLNPGIYEEEEKIVQYENR